MGLAPGVERSFLVENWADFDQTLWELEKKNARNSACFENNLPLIIGCEQDLEIANQAKSNIVAAGLENYIQIQNSHFQELSMPQEIGVIVCNPPYGRRLGHEEELAFLYKELGAYLKQNASGWDCWILSGNRELTPSLRMKCKRRFPVSNGGIDCRWLHYEIH